MLPTFNRTGPLIHDQVLFATERVFARNEFQGLGEQIEVLQAFFWTVECVA